MAHNNYNLNTKYFLINSGNFENSGLVSQTFSAYVINPTTLQGMGFNPNSILTANQFNTFKTAISAPLSVSSASDFLLSNWIAKGWGSDAFTVLEKYNAFISAHVELGGAIASQFNPEGLSISSIVANGSMRQSAGGSNNYFLPILVFGKQSDEDPQATGQIKATYSASGIKYFSIFAGLPGTSVKVQHSQGGARTLRYDKYDTATLAAFQAEHPGAEPQFRPSWTEIAGDTTGFRMMMQLNKNYYMGFSDPSRIMFNTIIGEPGYNDASQSSVPGFIPGVTHSFDGYYNTDFAQLGYLANSTNEFGMAAGLDGQSGELLGWAKVTFENYLEKYSMWSSDPRSFISAEGFTVPVTIRIYELSEDGAEVGALLGKYTQDVLMQWVPEEKERGIAFNVVFDLGNLQLYVPASEKVVLTVAYNTQTRGYKPTGESGPYNSLGVAVMEKVYDSGNGNVTYGTSAGSLVSDNGFYWCNTFPVGNALSYLDMCRNKSLAVIKTGPIDLFKTDLRVILATNSSAAITSTNAQVASLIKVTDPAHVLASGYNNTAVAFDSTNLTIPSENFVEPVVTAVNPIYTDSYYTLIEVSYTGWADYSEAQIYDPMMNPSNPWYSAYTGAVEGTTLQRLGGGSSKSCRLRVYNSYTEETSDWFEFVLLGVP